VEWEDPRKNFDLTKALVQHAKCRLVAGEFCFTLRASTDVHYHCFCISPHHRHFTAIAQNTNTKKPPEGGFTTLLIALILFLSFPWYPERDLNPHSANAEGF
ncbi:TPA: hypothetical protein ACPTYI_004502, partial [Escherichia coli]